MSAPTTSKRRQRAQPLSVSPTIAKLIAQIHAEAEAQTLTALSAKDGIVTLHPVDPDTARTTFEFGQMTHRDLRGNQIYAIRRHQEPEQWRNVDYMRGHWHPAYWDVCLTRIDANGQRWNAELGRHVMDDFGALVCIESNKA